MVESIDTLEDTRLMKPAIWNGLCLKCPRCGEGRLLHSYLKVRSQCDHCGLDLSHQRADDGPAYLTILIVCHLLGFVLHIVYAYGDPEPLMVALVLSVVSVGVSLAMLPRCKGLIIAIQWAKRMHGF